MGYSKIILVGHAGKDPEVKILSGGKKVATFSMAVNKPYTDRNGDKKEKVEWFDIEAWESKADIIDKYLEKGQELLIEGDPKVVSWESPTGAKSKKIVVVVSVVQFCGGISKARPVEVKPEPEPETADEPVDDLPF